MRPPGGHGLGSVFGPHADDAAACFPYEKFALDNARLYRHLHWKFWSGPRNEKIPSGLTYVTHWTKVTYMEKIQVYLRKEELDALRKAAARSGRSVAELVRDAIRKTELKARAAGPVAIWDGEPKRTSIEHDSVHDEP